MDGCKETLCDICAHLPVCILQNELTDRLKEVEQYNTNWLHFNVKCDHFLIKCTGVSCAFEKEEI